MWKRNLSLAILVPFTIWAAAALYFDVRIPPLRLPLAVGYLVFVAAALRTARGRLLCLASALLVLMWWLSLRPNNDQNWQPDVAQLPWSETRGDQIILHNVRNFDYRTETDFTQRWESRTIDLSTIQGVDIFMTHWGAPLIAHVIVSFRFAKPPEQDTFVAMSIEARKAVGQEYSAIRGLFRQFQLIFIAADERDIVRLRTNYRKNELVHLYHTKLNPKDSRDLFLQYLQWMEDQRAQPRWYNAVTANCSTVLTSYLEQQHIGGFSRWDPRILFNGKGEQMLYEHDDLATGGLSFAELSRQALINDRAKALDQDPQFSTQIRKGRAGF